MRNKKDIVSRVRVIGNQPEQQDNTGRIIDLLASTSREHACAVEREQRIQELMKRRSHRFLSPHKKARASRRLLAASQLVRSSADLKEQLQHRLEQLATVS